MLEKDKNGNNPTVEYNIPCCGDEEKTSTTQIIEDKGTRVRIEKRDSKYNYIIPDETTFELYRCKKGEECNPSDYSHVDSTTGKLVIDKEAVKNAGMKQIKFAPRAVLKKDEEDPTDAEGLVGVEVYNAMSDNDIKSGKTSVTELHTYHGILVLRYLQSGYNYVLVETVAPKNYMLPIGRDTQTRLTVVNNTVDVESVDMPNKPTSLLIRKYSNDGKLLPGAEFKIYETTEKDEEGKYKCNSNLSAKNQNKKEMKFKVIRDGVYEYKPELTDSIVKTCNDVNGVCSGIPQNPSTQLTYDTYKNTWADFANTTTSDGKTIEIQEGEALIQYLEYGHCYVIEETKAPEGYSLPSKEEERYTMVYIDENDSYYHDTETTLINKPTPFTFYKYDEFNKLIDGGEFKLQRLNSEKKYEDVAVELYEESEDGKLYYKVVEEGLNYTMRTYNGSATVYFLKQGQYRIVETKAPEGKELSKNPNIATFFVDNKGNVYGNSLIVNKGKTEKIDVKPSASAMLIVNIQTGQVVIRYGLIISFLVASIAGLMLYLRKKNRG